MNPIYDFLKLNFDSSSACLPFGIRTIEWVKEQPVEEQIVSYQSKHYMIIWLTQGCGTFHVDLNRGVVENNLLLFIKPGQFLALELVDCLTGYVISFDEKFLVMADHDSQSIYGHLCQMLAKTDATVISNASALDIKEIIGIMLKEFNNHNLYRSEILRRYFKIFLIYLSRQSGAPIKAQQPPRSAELLQNFMISVDKNFKTKRMVADYAEQLFVTANYLNEVVKKITGHSAGYHIRQRIALEAKRQAAYTNICMKKIAYDLGFCDMAHFSKFFKNTTGVNFSEFKKTQLALHLIF